MRTVSDSQRLKPFDVARFKDSEMASQFRLELQIHFEALAQEEDNSVESQWDRFRSTVVNSTATLIGRRRGMFHERWIQRDMWDLIDERNKAKQVRDQEPPGQVLDAADMRYRLMDGQTKLPSR